MDYREHEPGPALAGLVKAFWELDAGGDGADWVEHKATPDGCVEIIRRLSGRSRWAGDQPDCFAVGLADEPAAFEISGDSRFAAVRIWPWTWTLLTDVPLETISGRWVALDDPGLATVCRSLPDRARTEATLLDKLAGTPPAFAATARALVEAGSVAAMGRATGMGPRRLQRWFERHVGMPPRRYLRLLRFQKAFERVPGEQRLADHAAEHGFADQAHMAREFRSMAGVPARRAREKARGPFLS